MTKASTIAARPTTGRALPLFDREHTERVSEAQEKHATIWIPHGAAIAVQERIEGMRLSTAGKRGTPLPGLRLSQASQAGKSRTLLQYREDLTRRMVASGTPVNPYQVLYVNLRIGVTLKMLCQQVLFQLGDPHWKSGNIEEITLRMEEFIRFRDVELLIVDEVQWLAKARKDCEVVTDQLKNFLNDGIVPLVLAGNEESRALFEMNTQLASRLGVPLELSPLSTKEQAAARAFKAFCAQLDAAIVDRSIFHRKSNFDDAAILRGLMQASCGHVGRVCRIVEAALEHAIRRDAEFIEAYDLSYAVGHFAIPADYCSTNPFEVAA